MPEFLSTVTGIVISIGGVFAVVVVGGLYMWGIFVGKKNNQDDRLISLLNETVSALEGKVDMQKKDHDENIQALTDQIGILTEKVNVLQSENETLVKVLQGRDEKTQEFYTKAFDAMKIASDTHVIVKEVSKTQTELMKVLISHLQPGVTVNVPSQTTAA